MSGDYILLLPVAAGALFMAVVGYVSAEEAIENRRARRASGPAAAAPPATEQRVPAILEHS